MFRTKSLLVFAVVMMVTLTSSVMALDTVTLRQNMYKTQIPSEQGDAAIEAALQAASEEVKPPSSPIS